MKMKKIIDILKDGIIGFSTLLQRNITINEVSLCSRIEGYDDDVSNWDVIIIDSEYYGTHEENGEGSRTYIYVIRPDTYQDEISSMRSFSHGHGSCSADEERFNAMEDDDSNVVYIASL